MYKSLGYTVYRTVLEYYSGDPDEDAYGIILNTNNNFSIHSEIDYLTKLYFQI